MITDSLFYAEKKPIKKVALLFSIPMYNTPHIRDQKARLLS